MGSCRHWTVVATQASGVIDAAVSTEDLDATPEVAYSVLCNTINQLAVGAWQESRRMVSDDDAARGYPKTTVEVTVCLHPIRVLLMPTLDWTPVSPLVN